MATKVKGRLLTVDQCAAKLGISRWTMYRLLGEDEHQHRAGGSAPPSIRIGRVFRFVPAALERWIEEQASNV